MSTIPLEGGRSERWKADRGPAGAVQQWKALSGFLFFLSVLMCVLAAFLRYVSRGVCTYAPKDVTGWAYAQMLDIYQALQCGKHFSAQVWVVQGARPEVVRPPGGVQHAAGDRWRGVHWLPLQRLVHGHGDRREGLLRQLALQHSGGNALCQTTEPLGKRGGRQ